MLACNHISLSRGGKFLFSCEQLQMDKGVFALVGRNGSGKSSFIQAILADIPLDKGSIKLNGQEVDQLSLSSLSKMVSVVKSRGNLFGDNRTKDVLMLGRLPHQNLFAKPTIEDRVKLIDVAELLGIGDWLDMAYNQLSDGEKQLVMIGRALVQDTPLILLDEPSAFLDLVNRRELMTLLNKLAKEQNKLIIFSTHHVERLGDYCDGILLIHDQEMMQINDPSIFSSEIESSFGIKL